MPTELSARSLLEGGWYALEQAGLLLADAVKLFDAGRHATAAGIAMLAREELGKGRILLEKRREVKGGKTIDVEQVRDLLEGHVAKQEAAQVSISVSGQAGSRLADVLKRSLPGKGLPPEELDAAQREFEAVVRAKAKRTPSDRHNARMRAFYVDPKDDGKTWSRPAAITHEEALKLLLDAVNDYAATKGNLGLPDENDKEWPERPPLPQQAWPAGVSGGTPVPVEVTVHRAPRRAPGGGEGTR